jgi:hypothetical protein
MTLPGLGRKRAINRRGDMLPRPGITSPPGDGHAAQVKVSTVDLKRSESAERTVDAL